MSWFIAIYRIIFFLGFIGARYWGNTDDLIFWGVLFVANIIVSAEWREI